MCTVGAKPLAITDCLNFGNPEDPDAMWQLVTAMTGLADACEQMGVPVTGNKVTAFVLGCALAGVTGAMSAPFLNTWNARQGTFDASVTCLAYVLIGGSRSIWGPLCGAALLVSLPELLRPLKDSRMILNGVVLVAACVYLPQGIMGGLAALRSRLSGRGGAA